MGDGLAGFQAHHLAGRFHVGGIVAGIVLPVGQGAPAIEGRLALQQLAQLGQGAGQVLSSRVARGRTGPGRGVAPPQQGASSSWRSSSKRLRPAAPRPAGCWRCGGAGSVPGPGAMPAPWPRSPLPARPAPARRRRRRRAGGSPRASSRGARASPGRRCSGATGSIPSRCRAPRAAPSPPRWPLRPGCRARPARSPGRHAARCCRGAGEHAAQQLLGSSRSAPSSSRLDVEAHAARPQRVDAKALAQGLAALGVLLLAALQLGALQGQARHQREALDGRLQQVLGLLRVAHLGLLGGDHHPQLPEVGTLLQGLAQLLQQHLWLQQPARLLRVGQPAVAEGDLGHQLAVDEVEIVQGLALVQVSSSMLLA